MPVLQSLLLCCSYNFKEEVAAAIGVQGRFRAFKLGQINVKCVAYTCVCSFVCVACLVVVVAPAAVFIACSVSSLWCCCVANRLPFRLTADRLV